MRKMRCVHLPDKGKATSVDSSRRLVTRAGQGSDQSAPMLRTGSARLCGPKNVPDPDRGAYRGGSVRGEVTLGGRRIAVLTSHSRDQLDGADAYTSALTELPAALTRLEEC
jgi:hypothetical protein